MIFIVDAPQEYTRFFVLVIQFQSLFLTPPPSPHSEEAKPGLRELPREKETNPAVIPAGVVVAAESDAQQEELRRLVVVLQRHVHARHVKADVLRSLEGEHEIANLR